MRALKESIKKEEEEEDGSKCRGKSNFLFVFVSTTPFNLGFFKCVKYEANFSVFFHQTSVKGKKPVGFTFLGQRVVRVHLFLGDFLT